MAQAGSGGGITMNKNVSGKVAGGLRTTQPADPAGVSQLGAAQGGRLKGASSFTGINTSKPVFESPKTAPVPLGNAIAGNVNGGGAGVGRVVMRSGSQGQHGAPAPGQARGQRDILSEFGRDAPAASMVHKRGA